MVPFYIVHSRSSYCFLPVDRRATGTGTEGFRCRSTSSQAPEVDVVVVEQWASQAPFVAAEVPEVSCLSKVAAIVALWFRDP